MLDEESTTETTTATETKEENTGQKKSTSSVSSVNKKEASSPNKKKKKKKRKPGEKSKAEKNWLSHSLATHFSSFDDLHEHTRDKWVDAMEKTDIAAGTKIMEQGDVNGSYMYIVGTGFFDVYVSGKLVVSLGPGSLFGELALLFAGKNNVTCSNNTVQLEFILFHLFFCCFSL